MFAGIYFAQHHSSPDFFSRLRRNTVCKKHILRFPKNRITNDQPTVVPKLNQGTNRQTGCNPCPFRSGGVGRAPSERSRRVSFILSVAEGLDKKEHQKLMKCYFSKPASSINLTRHPDIIDIQQTINTRTYRNEI